jgi:hypothetical protein
MACGHDCGRTPAPQPTAPPQKLRIYPTLVGRRQPTTQECHTLTLSPLLKIQSRQVQAISQWTFACL